MDSLASKEKSVRMDRFGQVLEWFGPIVHPLSFFVGIRETLEQPWFHGDITAQTATTRILEHGINQSLI